MKKIFSYSHFRSIIAIVLSITVISTFLTYPQPTFAQSTGAIPQALVPNTDPNVPQNLHTFSQSLLIDILSSVVCGLSGYDPVTPNHECLGYNTKTGKLSYATQHNNGMIGFLGNMIATTYNPPIHTSQYVSYLQNHFGFSKKAYAAGTTCQGGGCGVGFQGIYPLLNVWLAFRNITYLLFILVFVLVGFAIMLRVRIDPRTVMTIENQIPKIIIGILLVTFSFAIAGFLVDLMWVLTFLVINVFTTVDPSIANTGAALGVFQHPIGYFQTIWPGGIFGLTAAAVGGLVSIVSSIFVPDALSGLSVQTGVTSSFDCGWTNVGGCIAVGLGIMLGAVITILAALITLIVVLIAIVVTLFRIWFMLLNAYIFIVLDIVLAPFWIVLGAIPGGGGGFGAWIRHIASRLICYPAVIFLLLMARTLQDTFQNAKNFFVPPLIGNPNFLGNAGANPIGAFLALGMLFTTPQILNMMMDTFKAPNNKYVGAGVAAGIGAGTAPIMAGARATGAYFAPNPAGTGTGGPWAFVRSMFRF